MSGKRHSSAVSAAGLISDTYDELVIGRNWLPESSLEIVKSLAKGGFFNLLVDVDETIEETVEEEIDYPTATCVCGHVLIDISEDGDEPEWTHHLGAHYWGGDHEPSPA